MSNMGALMVGVKLKEVATPGHAYQNVTVLNADAIGLVFEVQRTVMEGGDVENVVSHIFVPWSNVNHIVLREERS